MRCNTNGAWLIVATLAHNLARWMDLLGAVADRPWVAATLRRRLLAIPGRLTRTAPLDAAPAHRLAMASPL